MAPVTADAAAQRGLKSVVWLKFKSLVLDDCKKEEEWKVMLLDSFTTKLLSSCCKMSDLLAEGITVVEDIYKKREPVPHRKAVYFIAPTEKSVDELVNDFSGKTPCKYKAAYVYFSDFCPDDLFKKLASCAPKTIRRCKEINISFFPLESQAFILDTPDAFYNFYSPDETVDKEAMMEAVAQQIVTLCATLDENPGIRYKSEPLDNSNYLASMVEGKLVKYYQMDVINQNKGKTQSQMLILDRGFDPVSTILHELTFQAMAYDLLPIENDTYKYKTEGSQCQEKEARLEEDDDLWRQIRHMHIADVAEKIPKLVKEIASTKKASEGKQVSISSLSSLMKKMPNFRKQISKQVLHLNLAEDCLKKFKESIDKLCKAEQDLALGTDESGQKVKDPMRVLLPVVLNKNFGNYDKIRAILLYIFGGNGTTQENLDKLIQHVHIENDGDVIRNWKYLGVPILASTASKCHKTTRRDRSEVETYQLSRWTPVIKDVMEDTIENKLVEKEWPFCSQCSAAGNGTGAVSARQKLKPNQTEDRKNVSKLIIFIIGGMTYSEMRCAYEVTKDHPSWEVIIGSTHMLTPKKILDDLKALNKPLVSKDTVSIVNESKC